MKVRASMLRAGLAALVLLAVALAPRPSAAIDIQEVRSARGITAWLIRDASVPLVSIEFAFRGGSALDPAGKGGLAAFVSGMLDEGAGPHESSAFQKQLEDNSITMRFRAALDAFTGSLYTLNRTRDKAAELLNLALTRPRFDAEPLARVRGQILAEAERETERPRNIADQVWHKTTFGDHPYARDIDSTRRSIADIGADDLKAFVGRRFARDNLVVGVVGDIAPDELSALLDRIFGDLPANAASWRVPEARIGNAGKVVVVDRRIPQTVVQFGQAGLPMSDPDYYAAMVMNYILGGGGLTTRLADEVREKRGLAYSIYTRLVNYDRAGVLMGWVATRNERVRETIDIVRAEWKRMAATPITEKELADAKAYLTGSYFTRLNSTQRIARLLLGLQLDHLGRDYLTRRNALINAVTVADVSRAARRLLRPDELTFIMVGRPEGMSATP